MIVALSGILLVSDLYGHIFQELRQQNSDAIVMPERLGFFLQYRDSRTEKSKVWDRLFLGRKKICSNFKTIKLMFCRVDALESP